MAPKAGSGGGDNCEIGCDSRLPTPSKLKQLRYAGYSAEFLDRVTEPNGNIPHKQIEGKKERE